MPLKTLSLVLFIGAVAASASGSAVPLTEEKLSAGVFLPVESPEVVDTEPEALQTLAKAVDEPVAKDASVITPLVDEVKQLIVGARQPGDVLTETRNVEVGYSIIGRIVTKEETFVMPYGHVVTQVVAINKKQDGTGANVVVNGGATGTSSISLRFKSQRRHGIHFIVSVYSKKMF